MKFTLNFIKEFFNPQKEASYIAERLTLAGVEVESLKKENNDWIFEIEVTSNRADLLSIFGLANEISAVLGKRLKILLPSIKKKTIDLKISVEDKKDCPLYIASVIKGIKVVKTPDWLKERLINCGINSVNSVVDIGNYSMLKWGHPLHIFDLDKIEGEIFIRRAKEGEFFLGLDGKERRLTSQNLVIADEKKIIALAGIIGAENSCVDENTKNILIETAVFSPLTIRKSRQILGISTESSYRFERKVFPQLLEATRATSIQLILKLCGGNFLGSKKVGGVSSSSKKIKLNVNSLKRYVGVDISFSEAKNILERLNCRVSKENKEVLKIEPPFFRDDLKEEVDIIEEVIRIYGYEKVPERLPSILPQKDDFYFWLSFKEFLTRLGLKEVITYSIVKESYLEKLKEKNFIKIVNPLRKEENALRTNLLLGIIEAIRYNLNQKNKIDGFFEIAHLYRKEDGKVIEEPYLGIGIIEKPLYLKSYIEEILKFLNIVDFEFKKADLPNFTSALFVEKDKKIVGFLGNLKKELRDFFDIKKEVYFAQLNLSLLKEMRKDKSFKPFSFYPKVSRDISLAKKKEFPFENIMRIIKSSVGEYLESVEIIDTYRGEKIPPDFEGFTLRLHYRSFERTLQSEEVDNLHNRLREKLVFEEVKGRIILR